MLELLMLKEILFIVMVLWILSYMIWTTTPFSVVMKLVRRCVFFNIVKTDWRPYSRRVVVAADAWQGETSANVSVSDFDDHYSFFG